MFIPLTLVDGEYPECTDRRVWINTDQISHMYRIRAAVGTYGGPDKPERTLIWLVDHQTAEVVKEPPEHIATTILAFGKP